MGAQGGLGHPPSWVTECVMEQSSHTWNVVGIAASRCAHSNPSRVCVCT